MSTSKKYVPAETKIKNSPKKSKKSSTKVFSKEYTPVSQNNTINSWLSKHNGEERKSKSSTKFTNQLMESNGDQLHTEISEKAKIPVQSNCTENRTSSQNKTRDNKKCDKFTKLDNVTTEEKQLKRKGSLKLIDMFTANESENGGKYSKKTNKTETLHEIPGNLNIPLDKNILKKTNSDNCKSSIRSAPNSSIHALPNKYNKDVSVITTLPKDRKEKKHNLVNKKEKQSKHVATKREEFKENPSNGKLGKKRKQMDIVDESEGKLEIQQKNALNAINKKEDRVTHKKSYKSPKSRKLYSKDVDSQNNQITTWLQRMSSDNSTNKNDLDEKSEKKRAKLKDKNDSVNSDSSIIEKNVENSKCVPAKRKHKRSKGSPGKLQGIFISPKSSTATVSKSATLQSSEIKNWLKMDVFDKITSKASSSSQLNVKQDEHQFKENIKAISSVTERKIAWLNKSGGEQVIPKTHNIKKIHSRKNIKKCSRKRNGSGFETDPMSPAIQHKLNEFINKASKPSNVNKRQKTIFSTSSSESCDFPSFTNPSKKAKTNKTGDSSKKYGVVIPSVEEILKEQKDFENYKNQMESFAALEHKSFELPFSVKDLNTTQENYESVLGCKHLSLTDIDEAFKRNLRYISAIFQGKKYSERHDRYFNNNSKTYSLTTKDLTYSTSTIVFNFEQKEHMITLLKNEFDPYDNLTPYFFQVLLPELCLKIFMDTHEMTHDEAIKYLDIRPIIDE